MTILLAAAGSSAPFSIPPPGGGVPRIDAMRLMISGSVSTTRLGLAIACASCRLSEETWFLRSLVCRWHSTTLSLASFSRLVMSSLALLSHAASRNAVGSSQEVRRQEDRQDERIVFSIK